MKFTGNPTSPMRPIGEVDLLTIRTWRQRYQCAAWWQDVTCNPQTVELRSNGYYVSWRFDGTVADAHFPAMFAGVAQGGGNKEQYIGKPADYDFCPYAYDWVWAHAEGRLEPGMRFRLDPGIGMDSEVHTMCSHDRTKPMHPDCPNVRTWTDYFLTTPDAEPSAP